MKQIPQQMKDQLQDYLDGTLSTAQQQNIEAQLANDAALRAWYDDLRRAHALLKETAPEQPSKNFTAMVMSGLNQLAPQPKWSVRNGLLLLTGVLVVVGIAMLLVASGTFDQTTTFNLNQINLPEKYKPGTLPTISLDGKMIINVIIVLNLVLAWLVLDRLVLRPYFERRRYEMV